MATDTYHLFSPYIDERYKAFSSRLSKTDTLPRLGIRIPQIRALSKGIDPDSIVPRFHEDVILKGFAIGYSALPYSEKLTKLSQMLDCLSSWDQTDTIQAAFRPKARERDEALSFFMDLLLDDERVYPKRMAMVFLMSCRRLYCNEALLDAILSHDDPEEYYISMAAAWALATFALDGIDAGEYREMVSEITFRRAEQKLRDSLRKQKNRQAYWNHP